MKAGQIADLVGAIREGGFPAFRIPTRPPPGPTPTGVGPTFSSHSMRRAREALEGRREWDYIKKEDRESTGGGGRETEDLEK